jgi:hypothetical protein
MSERRVWQPRSDVDVVADQLHAIDSFHRARAASKRTKQSARLPRETGMDAARRREVLRRQQDALVARCDYHLRHSVDILRSTALKRAVLAHRQPWFTGQLAVELESRGILVLEELRCGARTLGVAVAEQADILFLGDTLEMVPGIDVLTAARQLAPHTVVAVQAEDGADVQRLLHAGAAAVFTRRAAPPEVADELARLITV